MSVCLSVTFAIDVKAADFIYLFIFTYKKNITGVGLLEEFN